MPMIYSLEHYNGKLGINSDYQEWFKLTSVDLEFQIAFRHSRTFCKQS